jgi:transposase
VADTDDGPVPAEARASLEMLTVQLEGVKAQILENDRRIIASARATEVGCRLLKVPGIGPVLASAFVASVADPAIFKSGRDLAAGSGLYRGRTQAVARSALAASPKPATAICGRC